MRLTEDHIQVKETDHVFEIMYKYHNPESSTPYPEVRKVADIPKHVKIWTHESNCQKACDKIKKQDPEVIGPGKKILPL